MKKNIFLLSLIILNTTSLCAQQQNQTSYKRNSFDVSSNLFTTPEVTQFQKATFFESNNYTGKIDLKIPIYDIKYGEISVPVYLTYNSGGIKVDDIASDVGLGWSLVAGGSIIRNIKDIKDDTFTSARYGREDWDIGWEPFQFASEVGYFRKIEDIYKSHVSLGHVEGGFEELAKVDSSPDLFYISAPNVSSSFYLKNNEDLTQFTPIQLSGKELLFSSTSTGSLNVDQIGFDNRTIRGIEGLHLILSYGGNPMGTPIQIKDHYQYGKHDFKQFEFKNTNGSYYKFDQVDIIESIPNVLNLGKTVFGLPSIYSETRFGYKSYPTTWHLSEIKDFNNKKVEFKYDTYANSYIKTTREKSNDVYRGAYNPYGSRNWNEGCSFGLYPTFKYKDKNGFTWGEVDEQHYKAQEFYSVQRQRNKIKQIKWENNTIDFVYSTNRKDDPNEKSLDEIIVKSGNEIIKKIKLNHSYFNSSTNCTDWECYRLKLEGVEVLNSSGNKVEKYNFDYYYDEPLPRVHSAQQDYLGYYNGNGVEQANDLDNKIPTLYFHRNQGRLSILPFQRKDGTFTKLIPGNFSLEPNSKSLTGILKKVTLPTGGTTEFEYENNRFLLNGIEYLAGGARIKKQTINDDNGQSRILHYEYRDNGRPSGTINNIPVYGQIWGFNTSNTNNMAFVSFDKPKNEIELTEGAFVGYSKVKVFEQGNGYTDYSFTSSKDFPNEEIINKTIPNNRDVCTNILHQNSSFPNVAYIDNDLKRGKLISKNVYNSSNVLLQSQSNEYNHTVFNEEIIPFQRFINNYHDDPHYTRPEGLATNYENKIRVERNLLSKEETKEYLNGGVITNKKEIIYDPIYPFVKEEIIYNSKDEALITEYKYPYDFKGSTTANILISNNRINQPLSIINKINNQYVSSTYIEYNEFNNILQKSRILKRKGNDNYTENDVIIYFDNYDIKGNITQYRVGQYNIPVIIIYGYNNTLPIAKIEGLTLSQINSATISSINNQTNDNVLTEFISNLQKTYKEATITGYLHKPLVGIKQIIKPNGEIEKYNYDNSNRLEEIKNDKGEILETFEYNYKN